MGNEEQEWNGGKFPNSGREGLGLSEFIDSAGANSRDTAPPEKIREDGASSVPKSVLAAGAGLVLGYLLGRSIR